MGSMRPFGGGVSLQDIFRAIKTSSSAAGDNAVESAQGPCGEKLTGDEIAVTTRTVLRVLSQTDISQEQAALLALRCLDEAGVSAQDGITFGEFQRAVLAPVDADQAATRVPRMLLVYVLPVLYGISTRVGFVTLPLHALASGKSLVEVGLVVGLFQLMRALANLMIVRRGSAATLPLISVSLCGFLFNIFYPYHWLSCWAYTLTGLGEIIVSLQHEMTLLPCMASDTASLKRQFAWVCLGACIAFVAGGALFTFIGFHAACTMGAMATMSQLLLGGLLCWLCRRRVSFSPWIHFSPDAFALRPLAISVGSLVAMAHCCEGEMPSDHRTMIELIDCVLDRDMGRVALDTTVMECCVTSIMTADADNAVWQQREDCLVPVLGSGALVSLRSLPVACALHAPSPSTLGGVEEVAKSQAPWIVHPFILSQIFIALCIGTFLGSGGLYYQAVYGANAWAFGLSMGFGELLGMMTSHLLPKPRKREMPGPMHAEAPRLPLRQIILVLSVMATIAGVVLLFSSVQLSMGLLGAVVFQLSFQILNDVWTYLVNDLVYQLSPISQYRRLQGQGQMYRRMGNAVAGLLGPMLFGVWAPLPFIAAACLLTAWTLLLTIVLAWHGKSARRTQVRHIPDALAIAAAVQQIFSKQKASQAFSKQKAPQFDGSAVRGGGGIAGLPRTDSSDSLAGWSNDDDDLRSNVSFLMTEVFSHGIISLPRRLFCAL